MVVAQVLGSDHPVKICFQKLLDKVDCVIFTPKKEEDRKLVMGKERIRWRRKGGGYTFLESVVRRRFDDIQYWDNLHNRKNVSAHYSFLPLSPLPCIYNVMPYTQHKLIRAQELTFSLTPSSAKYFNNFSSLNVLNANIE